MTYAHIRYPDGRESTVSLRDLAPCPDNSASPDLRTAADTIIKTDTPANASAETLQTNKLSCEIKTSASMSSRRFRRESKPPIRYSSLGECREVLSM